MQTRERWLAVNGSPEGLLKITSCCGSLAIDRGEHGDRLVTQSDSAWSSLGPWQQEQAFVETDVLASQGSHIRQPHYAQQGQLGEIGEHRPVVLAQMGEHAGRIGRA